MGNKGTILLTIRRVVYHYRKKEVYNPYKHHPHSHHCKSIFLNIRNTYSMNLYLLGTFRRWKYFSVTNANFRSFCSNYSIMTLRKPHETSTKYEDSQGRKLKCDNHIPYHDQRYIIYSVIHNQTVPIWHDKCLH